MYGSPSKLSLAEWKVEYVSDAFTSEMCGVQGSCWENLKVLTTANEPLTSFDVAEGLDIHEGGIESHEMSIS